MSAYLHMPPVSRAALTAADERGFPILEVPLSVPFIAIAQEVAAAVQADSTQRLNAQLQVFGAVRWLTSGELDEEQVFARLARLSGLRLFICTVLGTPLLPGVPVPPPELRHLLPSSRTRRRPYRVASCCRSPLLADRLGISSPWSKQGWPILA